MFIFAKVKLKKCTNKIRDRNKIIRNQNEDIDNFLEDIFAKENRISQLQDVIDQLINDEMMKKEHSKGACKTSKKEKQHNEVVSSMTNNTKEEASLSQILQDEGENEFLLFQDIGTPSFASIETTRSSSSTMSVNGTLVRELLDIVEECCKEIQGLHELIKEAPSTAEVEILKNKMGISQAKVFKAILCALYDSIL